ncbi:MAG: ectoine utilization protein EutA, partial [Aestuariivirgaceae bacterium]
CAAPQAEAIFISCTALPAVTAIEEIEARTGKPVVTSNQASAWACLRHAGISAAVPGFGQLLDLPLP